MDLKADMNINIGSEHLVHTKIPKGSEYLKEISALQSFLQESYGLLVECLNDESDPEKIEEFIERLETEFTNDKT